MAARKLSRNVWVGGVFHAAGSTPSAEVAKLITNPKVWADEPSTTNSQPAKGNPTDAAAPAGKAPAKKTTAPKK